MLRIYGAKIGARTNIYPSACIYFPWNLEIGEDSSIGEWALIYNLGPIYIGDRSTVSQRVHLCAGTHDFRDPSLPLLKPPIQIGDEVWVCADVFVGPGVVVGNRAVLGARAVVVKDVTNGSIVAGNPAVSIGQREVFNGAG
ncbi:putative colanic acid biosynthesis acetyltransferase [Coraliomargarita parva]|uniref:putative colanic acid biosynthesis acetyltransferase n=1 Tax=Coraliomargarita parva TaxID=3014050 RepID=UPI0022B47FB4|nr:putative colanic acid biosynthesis acetyltransferase [Coraliomargarita parva]